MTNISDLTPPSLCQQRRGGGGRQGGAFNFRQDLISHFNQSGAFFSEFSSLRKSLKASQTCLKIEAGSGLKRKKEIKKNEIKKGRKG